MVKVCLAPGLVLLTIEGACAAMVVRDDKAFGRVWRLVVFHGDEQAGASVFRRTLMAEDIRAVRIRRADRADELTFVVCDEYRPDDSGSWGRASVTADAD